MKRKFAISGPTRKLTSMVGDITFGSSLTFNQELYYMAAKAKYS